MPDRCRIHPQAEPLRIGYADPPYPGMAHFYKDHPDYGGEVDHGELVARLDAEFDGWVLHTASTTLAQVLPLAPDARVLAWVKPFASFKKGVEFAYAWEPVLVKAARSPRAGRVVRDTFGFASRDWLAEPITMRRGLVGAKPERVVWWLLCAIGAEPTDEFVDMFPGSGAVTRAWERWRESFMPPERTLPLWRDGAALIEADRRERDHEC